MTKPDKAIDLAVIGAGPAGYSAAFEASRLGKTCTIIEADKAGGTCLNRGCIPTKALLYHAKKMHHAGITPSLEKISEKAWSAVSSGRKGLENKLKSSPGVNYIVGEATRIEQGAVLLKNGDSVSCKSIIIATGSKPAIIPGFEPDGKRILTSDGAMLLTEAPKTLTIIGAGAVGLEFAGLFSMLGTKVTVIEALDAPLAYEDRAVSSIIMRELKKNKISLLLGKKVQSADVSKNAVSISVEGTDKAIVSEMVISAPGRKPFVRLEGLDDLGITPGRRGEVAADNHLMVSEGIYVAGDILGGYMLAHEASEMGRVAARNALGASEKIDLTVVPRVVFISPEVASVGITERQATEHGIDYVVGSALFRGTGLTVATGEIVGEARIIVGKSDGIPVGASIVGASAAECIHEPAMAIAFKIEVGKWERMIHTHPTYSEVLHEAVRDASNKL